MSMVANKTITIKSPAFTQNGSIPVKHTCIGQNISPELILGDFPAETRSFALIVDDPDAQGGEFVHWVMWNIPLKDKIAENTSPGAQGKNGKGENNYTGPCPPTGTHHYYFRLYALSVKLDLPVNTSKNALLRAMEGHIVASGELIGHFKKI